MSEFYRISLAFARELIRNKFKEINYIINYRISFKACLAASFIRLQGYSGFDPTLCYGDILLSYVWESCRPSDHTVNDFGKKENAETAKIQPIPNEEIADKKMHDFIRTHFHRATHCDFCTKKVRHYNSIIYLFVELPICARWR